MTAALDTLVKGGLCHGCGGCASVLGAQSIQMSMTSTGYMRPQALRPLTAQDEAKLYQICSGATVEKERGKEANYDPVWGSLVSVSTGYAIDPSIRYHGSSGGVITAVLTHLLSTGQIDFVVQTGASLNDPVSNTTKVSFDGGDVLAMAGSRYAPSSPLSELETHLKAGRPFAFVGKPCDVATLRRMARHDPRIDQLIPVKLSFFCAGVPSRKGAIEVIKALGVAEEELVEFAYRGRGWPGLTRAVRHDGSEESMDYNSSWGTILNRHLQFRCKICPDGIGDFADIVCADAWHGKDGYPDFTEREGRSLIIARSQIGQSILDAMSLAGELKSEPLATAEIARMQPYQFDRKRGLMARLFAMRLKGFKTPKYKGLDIQKLARGAGPLFLARTLVGTYKRLRGKKVLD